MKAMVMPNPEVHRRKMMKRTVHFSVSLVSLKLWNCHPLTAEMLAILPTDT